MTTTYITFLLFISAMLHAETEKEFGERVAKTWNSKQAAGILSLYDDLDGLDPTIRQSLESMIEFQLTKGFDSAEFSLLPNTSPKKPIFMNNTMGYSMTEVAGNISVELGNGGGSTISPYVKKSDGSYALAVPATRKIDWAGDEMTTFQVIIRPGKNSSYIPTAVLVLERYGRVDYEVMNGNLSFRTHKIQHIIIPSTPEADSLTLEISRGMDNIVFKKSVDTTKGAMITPDLKAP